MYKSLSSLITTCLLSLCFFYPSLEAGDDARTLQEIVQFLYQDAEILSIKVQEVEEICQLAQEELRETALEIATASREFDQFARFVATREKGWEALYDWQRAFDSHMREIVRAKEQLEELKEEVHLSADQVRSLVKEMPKHTTEVQKIQWEEVVGLANFARSQHAQAKDVFQKAENSNRKLIHFYKEQTGEGLKVEGLLDELRDQELELSKWHQVIQDSLQVIKEVQIDQEEIAQLAEDARVMRQSAHEVKARGYASLKRDRRNLQKIESFYSKIQVLQGEVKPYVAELVSTLERAQGQIQHFESQLFSLKNRVEKLNEQIATSQEVQSLDAETHDAEAQLFLVRLYWDLIQERMRDIALFRAKGEETLAASTQKSTRELVALAKSWGTLLAHEPDETEGGFFILFHTFVPEFMMELSDDNKEGRSVSFENVTFKSSPYPLVVHIGKDALNYYVREQFSVGDKYGLALTIEKESDGVHGALFLEVEATFTNRAEAAKKYPNLPAVSGVIDLIQRDGRFVLQKSEQGEKVVILGGPLEKGWSSEMIQRMLKMVQKKGIAHLWGGLL